MTAGGSPERNTGTVSTGFAAALEWLYTFQDAERGVGWNARSSPHLEWNLRRTRILLDLAGAPDRRMVCVLVAGTKGKGSTAAMLASILAAAGIRAGLYTKPHLQSYRERLRVDGEAIGEGRFAELVAAMRPRVARLAALAPESGAPTTFELTTALALEHFALAGCTVAVVEVGLGGRLDATNAIDPHVSVVTPISRDHTAILGTRLADIAAEKAGILRPGRVAIIAPQPDAARRVLLAACARVAAEARPITPLTAKEAVRRAVSLRGAHQRTNAAVAIAAARALAEHGIPVSEASLSDGLKRLRWPGRLEIVEGTPATVLDGAHNDASAAALADALPQEFPRRRIRFVIGIMKDKDARAVVRPLVPLAASFDAVRAPGPRGLEPSAIARLVRGTTVRTHDGVAAAIAAARAAAAPRDVVCVTGSLALVGRARDVLGLPVAERLW